MAIQAKLSVDGGSIYNVVECEYNFHQSIDDTGKPVSRPQGGTITFTIPSTSDDDLFFYRWMLNKTEVQSGTITFTVFSNDNKPYFKTVQFKNAYCIELKDFFNRSDSNLMYTIVTISAQIINIGRIDQAVFNNEWT